MKRNPEATSNRSCFQTLIQASMPYCADDDIVIDVNENRCQITSTAMNTPKYPRNLWVTLQPQPDLVWPRFFSSAFHGSRSWFIIYSYCARFRNLTLQRKAHASNQSGVECAEVVSKLQIVIYALSNVNFSYSVWCISFLSVVTSALQLRRTSSLVVYLTQAFDPFAIEIAGMNEPISFEGR